MTMEETLARAKAYMQSGDYTRALVLLQRARNLCKCLHLFREKHQAKEHSSAKGCLRDAILSAALNEDEGDDDPVYKAATSPCSCGVPKLTCGNAVHMDVLDKIAACSAAMGKNEAAVGFAAAAIHLDPKSPVGYCRLSKLIRTRTLDGATLRSDIDNETMALAIVKHGMSNVEAYGDVEHPLYHVLQVVCRKLYRKDPLKIFPPEIRSMILSNLDTLELVRCQRVSKRWLYAIRDDDSLWTKLLFIFRGSKGNRAKQAKGMVKLVKQTKRASTLSVSPANFDEEQLHSIFSQLKHLRHLHLEPDDGAFVPQTICSAPPTHLTRLSFFAPPRSESGWLPSLLDASASTLEELQVTGLLKSISGAVFGNMLPRLRVLRLSPRTTWPSTLHLDLLSEQTPNLEQLCLDGTVIVDLGSPPSGQAVSYLWPHLKVLVVGRQVIFPTSSGKRLRLVPPGIRVIDDRADLTRSDIYSMEDPPEMSSLEHFRLGRTIEPEELGRVLGPSLANGSLKTLCLTWDLEELHKLNLRSDHVQALGLTFADFPKAHTVSPLYLKWAANFPKAHTFAIQTIVPTAAALASLALRPATKRIFDSCVKGVERDQLLEEAKARNVEVVYSAGFPVIFPWRLDDGGEGGELDVVEQWDRCSRGKALEPLFRACNQPFFRE